MDAQVKTLTLTRKTGERIRYTTPSGDRIEIEISEIRRNQVRIKSFAPEEIKIQRTEKLED